MLHAFPRCWIKSHYLTLVDIDRPLKGYNHRRVNHHPRSGTVPTRAEREPGGGSVDVTLLSATPCQLYTNELIGFDAEMTKWRTTSTNGGGGGVYVRPNERSNKNTSQLIRQSREVIRR